jgi:tRNA threonylcarbamoyladenosine biosynthesis protein TsaB
VIVLGFDTATLSTAVALRLADGRTLRARDDPEERERPGHATRLLAMAGELLSSAGIGWSELERIAVGVGPGRFTGLRVGVATARGLAQSLDLQLVGVSSLRALAHGLTPEDADGEGVLAVIDARRGEAFAAAYPASALGSSAELAAGELSFARALKPADLENVRALIEQRGAQAGGRWLALGDGAVFFREQLQTAGLNVPPDSSALHLIDAASICELALDAAPLEPHALVLPDYRRTPDAALARPAALPAGASPA